MSLTPEQMTLRRTGVTASELPVVAGVSRWRTPISIYQEKIGEPLDREEGLKADLGNLLEEPVAQIYSRLRGFRLVPCATLRHPDHPFILATPDRLALRPGGLTPPTVREIVANCSHNVQIKTTGWQLAHLWGEPDTDDIPIEVTIQVHAEMAVTGLDLTHVPVLFDRDRFEVYVVRFDEALWGDLLQIAERFWFDHVVPRKPPPVDASEEWGEVLERRFGGHYNDRRTPLVRADGDTLEMLRQFAAVDVIAKRLEGAKKLLANRMRDAIGKERGFLADGLGRVQWIRSPPKSGAVDWFLVASELRLLLGELVNAIDSGRAKPDFEVAKLASEIAEKAKTIEDRCRKPARGYSALRPTWEPEAVAKLEALLAPLALPVSDEGGKDVPQLAAQQGEPQ